MKLNTMKHFQNLRFTKPRSAVIRNSTIFDIAGGGNGHPNTSTRQMKHNLLCQLACSAPIMWRFAFTASYNKAVS